MVARTWNTNDFLSCSDMNYYVRDKGQTSLCIVTIGTGGFNASGPNSVQTIGIAAETGIFWPIEIIDTDGMHSTTVNPNWFTPTIPGWYVLQGWVSFATVNGGIRQVKCLLGGDTTLYGFHRSVFTGFEDVVLNCVSAPIFCNGTTDYIQVTGYQNSTQNVAISNGALSVYRIRG